MFLSSLFRSTGIRAATPENPRFNLNDPAAWDALGVQRSSSGVSINREVALTYSPWWRGLNLISGDVGKTPLFLYRRQGKGKAKDPKHPGYYLLRRKPNEIQTAGVFKRQLTGHALSCGNGYAYIFRQPDGTPRELVPMDPEQTCPLRENGKLLYLTHVENEPRKLLPENVLHIKGFSHDGLQGYSVYDKAREDLGGGIGARKFGTVFFKNNARPNIALEYPGRLDDKEVQVLRTSWERVHGGLDEQHRIGLLKGGMKLQTYSINARDAQLMELRQFQAREVANWLGIPAAKLGDTSAVSYASKEQSDQEYLDQGLDPWFWTWEEECWDKLLTEEEKEEELCLYEFERRALIRADMAARSGYFRTALGGRPWMTQNEVRDEEGLDPADDADADEILEPMNMGQGGGDNDAPPGGPPKTPPTPPGKQPPAKGPDDAEKAAGQQLLDAEAVRMIRRLAHAADRAAKKPGEFLAWLEAFADQHIGVIAGAILPGAQLLKEDPNELAGLLLMRVREELLDLSGQCTAVDLRARVSERMKALETALIPFAYDPDQPRDDGGRFSDGGGDSGDKGDNKGDNKGGGQGGDKPKGGEGSAALHEEAEQKSKTLAERVKELPGKIIQAARNKIREKYNKLEARYGRKTAIAIMAAGIVGTATPIPGGGLLAAAPLLGAAELYRHFRGKAAAPATASAEEEYTDEELKELGTEWMDEILDDWQKNDLPDLQEDDQ